MKRWGIVPLLIASLALAGCDLNGAPGSNIGAPGSDANSYCQQNPAVCVLVGAVIVGGVVGIFAADRTHSSTPPVSNCFNCVSDARLKTEIKPLPPMNGLPLYSYKYIGDDRIFVGVLAQDLLANPAWSSAVSIGPDGFYRVDYSALGLKVDNAATLQIAGEDAARRARI